MVAKPRFIELPDVEPIPILYEDRSVLAIDKPCGWMLVPVSWQKTSWNLQAAINSSIAAGDFWARSRNLKYLRYVHRLDADTSGVMLFAKSPGALEAYSALFESRRMQKVYLSVVHGIPKETEWTCNLKLAQDSRHIGKMKVDPHNGKEAETRFRVLQGGARLLASRKHPISENPAREDARPTESYSATPHPTTRTLVEARPLTGRTHQIRIHLAKSGFPIVGDDLYGRRDDKAALGLRAVSLAYIDPFTRRRVGVVAPTVEFCREYGFPEISVTDKSPG